jgi:hypothetical protein
MRKTSLIFVEGIMGAGKTTTAWFLTEQLQRQGLAARFPLEGPTVEDPVHPLRVATDLPHPNGVWLDMTIQQYIEYSGQKWQRFVEAARSSTSVTICDGLLFHGNMTDLLLMNAEPDVLFGYVRQVIQCIHPLNPVLIYFYHADVAQALRRVCDARGSEWEAYQVNWKVGSPFGVQRSLQGFAGLVQLYQSYRALCDDFFARLALPKLAIRNEGEWTTYYQQILTFLQLPPAPPEVLPRFE